MKGFTLQVGSRFVAFAANRKEAEKIAAYLGRKLGQAVVISRP